MGLEQISSKCRKPAPSCILRLTFLRVVFVVASFLGSSGRHQVFPRVVKSRQTSSYPQIELLLSKPEIRMLPALGP